MQRKTSFFRCLASAGVLFAVVMGLGATQKAHAQGFGDPYPPGYGFFTGTNVNDLLYTFVSNGMALTIGIGQNQGGALGLYTASSNDPVFDPSDTIAPYFPLNAVNVVDPTTGQQFTAYLGTHIFVRIDGGFSKLTPFGYDAIFGDQKLGQWIEAPQQVGNHIEAKWLSQPVLTNGGGNGGGGTGGGGTGGGGTGGGGTGGGGGGTTTVLPPAIEVDLVASFVHTQCRLQITVKNVDTKAHTVSIGLLEELSGNPQSSFLNFGTPLYLYPDNYAIHHETALYGAQIPSYFYSMARNTFTRITNALVYRTIKGTLVNSPYNQDPTFATSLPPSRMIIGNLLPMEGNLGGTAPNPRIYDEFWLYDSATPIPLLGITLLDPTQSIDQPNSESMGLGLYWDNFQVQPTTSKTIVTYLGDNSCNFTFGQPLSLAISAPQALQVSTSANQSVFAPPGATGTSNQFQISAYVDNTTDLINPNALALSPVTVTISLPKGLQLVPPPTNGFQNNANNPNNSATVTLPSLASGQELPVQWIVTPTGASTGPMDILVSAQPGNFGNGVIARRTIDVPAPASFTLRGNVTTQNHYVMLSIPLQTGPTPPSQVLFPTLPSQQVAPDLAQWDPVNLIYNPISQFSLGKAFWILNRIANDQQITLNTASYPPLLTTQQFTANYPQGWNQIGDPYIYPVNFGEVQIFDPSTGRTFSMQDAASPQNHLILPIAFYYDTSNPDPTQWHYVMLQNLGFTMQPYQGYWIYVLKNNLSFIYPGVTLPGSNITKATTIATNQSRVATDNWQLQLSASAADGIDNATVIGVAPQASDRADFFKYPKPPYINKQLTMEITHPEWNGAIYSEDLRSPSPVQKTWTLVINSVKPSEPVTIEWPNFSRHVPRTWKLTFTDPATGTQFDMRSRSGYVLHTDTTGRATVQITASPANPTPSVRILSFVVNAPTRAASGTTAPVELDYSIAGSGDTHVLVRNSHGQVIRNLTPVATRNTANGLEGKAVWDMKTQSGTVVSTGVYTMDLVVVAPDGTQTHQTRVCVITR
jgi:uncharacterized membrane protein YgcG